ncbi:MAG: hypothetical protein HQK86_13595 [Nitrospinae bacterium]|nr:hypothetical protein [Nitrospinota bacterium]
MSYADENAWIVAIIPVVGVELYSCTFLSEKPRTLISKDGYYLMFQSEDKYKEVLSNEGYNLNEYVFGENIYVFDIPRVTYLLSMEEYDPSAEIVELLNYLDDCRLDLNIDYPANFKKHLFDFCDHLTFEKEYGEFFKNNTNITRQNILDAYYWCLGSVMSRTKIVI